MQFSIDYFYNLCFLIMYIVSIVFIYKKFSEIIAFFILFITHTTFIIYIGRYLYNFITNGYYFITMLASFSIIIALIFNFISIIFIIQLIMSLRNKFTIQRETPIKLSKKYQNKMDEFKIILVITFVSVFILLSILSYGIRYIDINFYELIENINMTVIFKNMPVFVTLLISMGVLGLSGYQMFLGNELSYSQNNQIIAKK